MQTAAGTGASLLLGSAHMEPLQARSQTKRSPGSRKPEIVDIEWEMGPPLPFPSKGQAQAVVGESIIGAGGAQLMQRLPPDLVTKGSSTPLAKQHIFEGIYMPWGKAAWRLDTHNLKYEILPEAPVGFSWPMGVAVGQDFYVLTGYLRPADDRDRAKLKRLSGPDGREFWRPPTHAGGDHTSKRVFRLSRHSGEWRWEEVSSLRIGRFLPGVATAGTKIVVLGGQASFGAAPFSADFWGGEINAVEVFDTAAPQAGWTDLPPIPWIGRESMGTAAIGENVYIFGGVYTNLSHAAKNQPFRGFASVWPLRRHCGDAYVLNLESRRWRKLPDLPFPIAAWEAVAYKNRYIILVGGMKDLPVDHPYAYKDRIPEISSPNFEVLVFDAVKETYKVLPTRIPPYQIHPAHIEAKGLESQLHDVTKGGYRVASKLSVVGSKVYLCAGEVISPHNVTDEVLVGTILEG